MGFLSNTIRPTFSLNMKTFGEMKCELHRRRDIIRKVLCCYSSSNEFQKTEKKVLSEEVIFNTNFSVINVFHLQIIPSKQRRLKSEKREIWNKIQGIKRFKKNSLRIDKCIIFRKSFEKLKSLGVCEIYELKSSTNVKIKKFNKSKIYTDQELSIRISNMQTNPIPVENRFIKIWRIQ